MVHFALPLIRLALPENLPVGPNGAWLAAAGVLVLFGVPWLLMPFALFGLKKRLDRIGSTLESIQRVVPRSYRPGEDIPLSGTEREPFSSIRRG